MPPRCIVSDLDRTLTGSDLNVDPAAIARIRELRRIGIRVVVATGRRLEELADMGIPDEVDGLVAENGAIVLLPNGDSMEVLHSDFGQMARKALGDLGPLFQWGRVIGSGPRKLAFAASERLVAGRVAHAMEFNAEDVMLLPRGVDKASGAERCLARLGLGASDAWAIGDGENDVALLRWAAVGAAPANAVPPAREAADVLLAASYSQAFVELTEPLVAEAPRAR